MLMLLVKIYKKAVFEKPIFAKFKRVKKVVVTSSNHTPNILIFLAKVCLTGIKADLQNLGLLKLFIFPLFTKICRVGHLAPSPSGKIRLTRLTPIRFLFYQPNIFI